MIEGDADNRTEVTQLAALLRVAGNVHFALWRTVADEAGGHIIFGYRDPKGRAPVGIDNHGIGLPGWPVCAQQLGLHDVGLPGVRLGLAVAHELGWCRDFDLGLPLRPLIKVLADE